MNYLEFVVCGTANRCHDVSLKHLNYTKGPFEFAGVSWATWAYSLGNPASVCFSSYAASARNVFIFTFIPKCARQASCQMNSRYLGVDVRVSGGVGRGDFLK